MLHNRHTEVSINLKSIVHEFSKVELVCISRSQIKKWHITRTSEAPLGPHSSHDSSRVTDVLTPNTIVLHVFDLYINRIRPYVFLYISHLLLNVTFLRMIDPPALKTHMCMHARAHTHPKLKMLNEIFQISWRHQGTGKS